MRNCLLLLMWFVWTTACSTSAPASDAGVPGDVGIVVDSGSSDAGEADAGEIDAGLIDAGTDAGPADVGFDSGPVDSGFDAGPADAGVDAGPECPLPDGGCHALEQQSDEVQPIAIADVAPAPTGGTVEPGVYVLTDSRYYTGPQGDEGPVGPTSRITVQLRQTADGTFVDLLNSFPDCQEQRMTLALTIADTSFLSTQVCPSDCAPNCDGMLSYSATPTALTLQATHEDGVEVEVFTRLTPDAGP